MAVGWLTVLKMVPWGDVIENAPKVAQGAKKLWSSVGKKPVASPAMPESGSSQLAAPTLASLQAQVTALQLTTAELHQQMQDSSALIQALAEQNTELIKRVEVNRLRVVWLFVLVVALAIGVLVKVF